MSSESGFARLGSTPSCLSAAVSITGAGAAESWAACDDGGGGYAGKSGLQMVVELGKQEGREGGAATRPTTR